jgi:hypothetical protein
MRRPVPILVIVAASLTLGACSYDPPMQGDHAAEKYQTDLKQCHDSVDPKVELQGRATFPNFLVSPITVPPRRRAGVRDCMVGKGYALKE